MNDQQNSGGTGGTLLAAKTEAFLADSSSGVSDPEYLDSRNVAASDP